MILSALLLFGTEIPFGYIEPGFFVHRLEYASALVVSALLIVHSTPLTVRSRYYAVLKQPFVYWALFVWALYHMANDVPNALTGALPNREHFTLFSALAYVVNLLTFSDSGEVIPATAISHFVVMVIKVSNLAFLIWFIAFIVKQRLQAQFRGDVTAGDFERVQEYMLDILKKSGVVNDFFRKLDADIAQSKTNIAQLEQTREELARLRSIEQKEVEAVVNSVEQVVQRQLSKTAGPNFLSNIVAGAVVALAGYLLGKMVEAILR
jgi:uncharacterized membrane protein (UPF0136 family)